MKLSNQTILITGGTSGIGYELARQLLERGNTVIITGRDQEKLDTTKKKLPGVHMVRSDVSDPQSITALYDKIIHEFPTMNVLVNNAGIMRKINLHQPHELTDITREIAINLDGPVRMVQQFLPHLKAQKDAAIVNVSSGLAFVPFPISPIYSATKAGLHAYTLALRVQMKRNPNVKIIELAPPGTDTPLFHNGFEDELGSMKGMDVAVLVKHAITGIEKGNLEIRPGLSNVLKIMSRIAPQFMLNQFGKMADNMLAKNKQ